MYKKSVIKFKLQELTDYVEDPKSCVKCLRRKQHLSVLPWCLEDLKKSVEGILNRKIAHYDKCLDGILLSARNIMLLSSLGALRNDSPEIHIDIEADFYIFQPEIGSVLEGVVIKKHEHFIGCLVHRVFNITIPRNNEHNWPGSYLEIGNNVVFKVIYMDFTGKIPHIRGEIDTSNMEYEDMSLNDSTMHEEHIHLKESKKNKRICFDDMLLNENEEPAEINQSNRKRKKSKKHKKDSSPMDVNENDSVIDERDISDVNKKRSKNSSTIKESEIQTAVCTPSYTLNIDKYKNMKSQLLSPSKVSPVVEATSPSRKINSNKRKPRTDSEGYNTEPVHEEMSNSKISSSSTTSEVNKSNNKSLLKRDSLVSSLLNMAKNTLSTTKKLKHSIMHDVSDNNETSIEHRAEKISKKRKLSLESPIKVKKFKKSL